MTLLGELLQYTYLRHALAACLLSGIACGLVGSYVVARRMVFLGGGITHSSFGGLGIALWAGTNPIVGALCFAVASALGIEWASQRGRIREDSAIGIVWSVGMAVGIVFLSLRPGYTSTDLVSYLFGSILTVTRGDVWALLAATLLLVAGAALWLRPIMYVAFDRDYAASAGIPVSRVGYAMAVATAVVIVLSIRTMGIVLLISLLTLPAVVANALTRSFGRMAVIACLVGVGGNVAGLALSYAFEIPPSTAIIFLLVLTLVAVKWLPLRRHKRSGRS